MRLVVDGVFFQIARTGISRVWSSLLPRLAAYGGVEITLLDRGNCPAIPGIERIPFPSYVLEANSAADSVLLDKVCHQFGADVFLSSFYTTPLSVPSVLMVYDMIPEVLGFDLTHRIWREKQIAISFASYYACISEQTRSDLRKFYPSIHADRAVVSRCGIERAIFHPRTAAEVEAFREVRGLSNSYYLLVAGAVRYKNVAHVFDALRTVRDVKVDLLCSGAEVIDSALVTGLPDNVSVRQLFLSDDELACAYSGARALIFPSLYEGFGLPVSEAMACACPVITTKHGALAEVAGDAAFFVSGHDPEELKAAMALATIPEHRAPLIERGLRRASRYDWDDAASALFSVIERAARERNSDANRAFFADWKRLRYLQAEVDIGE